MSLLEKFYSIIILLSVVLGLGLGNFMIVANDADLFIVPLLIGMLYITFLQIPIEDIKDSFKNIRFTYATVIMNFVWTPLFAWLLAYIFLAEHPALWIGFIMLMVTPCTDWYLIFTGMARGNVALSTTILPLNLILQVLLLPLYLLLFGGAKGTIEISFLVECVLIVLIIPLLLAFITKSILSKKKHIEDKILSNLSIFPIIFLSLAIVAMFASQGSLLLNHLDLLLKILIPILLFFVVNFMIGQKVASQCQFPYEDKVSFNLTTLARNSPIALAIAMTAFPNQPLIALTLVIGPLLELPILALVAQLLLLLRKREDKEKHTT
ncbi:arsenic resistance protein [Ammoniphilus sp. CFH 90114]|uniref:arsenic resistance protein n=1 Tax=Ammoniphilus sp. CFH 90114 TaxID=2493665 RepID=UPI00100E698B|nr:bile acid:sodium symporter [Ammoniphilus sp. CFH 90114]RXT03901.1 arsenic resistance protein [Ammoniphilus sp. CFH 90114]